MNKWDCIKLKSFCTAMEIFTYTKDNPQLQKIFTSSSFDKELISRIYRELKNINPRKTNTAMKNGHMN
jgi:hypothetical protein